MLPTAEENRTLTSVSWNLTVRSSTFSYFGKPPLLSLNRSLTELATRLSRMTSTFQITSSAVNGAPSDHFSPARSLNVQVRPSSLTDWDSASSWFSSKVLELKSTRPWYTGPLMSEVVEVSLATTGLKDLGFPWVGMIRLPP